MINWEDFLQFITGAGLRLFQAFLLLIAGWFVIKYFTKWITSLKGFKKLDIGAQSFLKSLLSVGLKVILFISIIGVLGVPLTSILTVLASAGLAIGLALQGALS